MVTRRPFSSASALYDSADNAWAEMERGDVEEALSHHPLLGQDLNTLRERFETTATWAEGEQRGVKGASDRALSQLAEVNERYARTFGINPVVCATGLTAEQMVQILTARLQNSPDTEWRVAGEEQRKITRIRLEKLP